MNEEIETLKGCDLAIKILWNLSFEPLLFEKWIEQLSQNQISFADTLKKAIQLRSVYKMQCRHTVDKEKKWDMRFQPFSSKDISVKLENISLESKACLLKLIQNKFDGFWTISRQVRGTEIIYKHFAHDNLINAYLEKGLGLLMFLNTLQSMRKIELTEIETLKTVLIGAKIPNKELQLLSKTYKKNMITELIYDMFSRKKDL